ncbi:hypothetical protein PM082_006679 [Marasmius tenuissimus]|nr:hypothetical protein PM082_006679 [Marasmius tenuissimus]
MSTTIPASHQSSSFVLSTFCLDNPRVCAVSDFSLAGTTVSFLFYGGYVVLFAICVSILSTRAVERERELRWHRVIISSLFVLTTTSVALNTTVSFIVNPSQDRSSNIPYFKDTTGDPSQGPDGILFGPGKLTYSEFLSTLAESDGPLQRPDNPLADASQAIMVTSNLLVDIILLWRCYLIWGSRVRIIILPAMLCFVNNVLGYLTIVHFDGHPNSFIGLMGQSKDGLHLRLLPQAVLLLTFSIGSLISNVLLTTMIAGKVFCISHEVSKYTQKPVGVMYRTVIHASIESGSFYPLALLIYSFIIMAANGILRQHPSCVNDCNSNPSVQALTLGADVIRSSLVPIMGIASTLIIVRTTLGLAINDEKSFIATVLRENDSYASASAFTGGAIDVREISGAV